MPYGFDPNKGAASDFDTSEPPAVHPNAAASYVAGLEAEKAAAEAVGNKEQAKAVADALSEFKSARLGSKNASVETRDDSTPGPKSSRS